MLQPAEQRLLLIEDIVRGFDLTSEQVGELADAMRTGTDLGRVLHTEFLLRYPYQRQDQVVPLAQQLARCLEQAQVTEPWRTLLPQRLRPGVVYLYYVAPDGTTYGRWYIKVSV